ncbi:unnamed protein product, partial [Iphiclides podalirius]
MRRASHEEAWDSECAVRLSPPATAFHCNCYGSPEPYSQKPDQIRGRGARKNQSAAGRTGRKGERLRGYRYQSAIGV